MSAILEGATLTDDDYKEAVSRLFEAKKREGFTPVALLLYRNADGSILYGRVRMHKPDPTEAKCYSKFIRPFWHDGTRWTPGEPPQPRGNLLYGLRELLASAEADVYVVEGEQKADALNRIGAGRFVAVTSKAADNATRCRYGGNVGLQRQWARSNHLQAHRQVRALTAGTLPLFA